MSLVLLLETSSTAYGVAVGTRQELLYHRTVRRAGGSFPGIGQLASDALDAVDAAFPDVELIAVDVGPGNLSSVRTGIAYANGLSFSMGRAIFCANSLELLAVEVAPPDGGAALSLRTAGGGDVYAGLFRNGVTLGLRHGPMAETVTALCQGQSQVSVAGAFRPEAESLLSRTSGMHVKDTGLAAPDVRSLHQLLVHRQPQAADLVAVASPLTETSEVFRE